MINNFCLMSCFIGVLGGVFIAMFYGWYALGMAKKNNDCYLNKRKEQDEHSHGLDEVMK